VARPEALDVCPWLCGGPNYPSTPFVGPVFLVVDSLRVLIALGSLALVLISAWGIPRAGSSGQKCRFLGYIGFSLFVAGTEISRLGDWPHWRFLVGLVTVPVALYGSYQHLFHETPAHDRQRENSEGP
jgi:hypothetical protein